MFDPVINLEKDLVLNLKPCIPCHKVGPPSPVVNGVKQPKWHYKGVTWDLSLLTMGYI